MQLLKVPLRTPTSPARETAAISSSNSPVASLTAIAVPTIVGPGCLAATGPATRAAAMAATESSEMKRRMDFLLGG